MKASRIQALAQQSTTVQRNLQQARGAFALRPQTSARQLVQARNQGDTVLADITEAETELSHELNAAETQTQQAQGALQQAQQVAAGEGNVAGTHTSAEIRAQQSLQAAQAKAQPLQAQSQQLAETRQPLQAAVEEARDGEGLLHGVQDQRQREAASLALEKAESSVGPPKRRAKAATVARSAAAGAAIGGVITGGLGALAGGIAGTFLGSTAIGAAVGAGAGALLGAGAGALIGGLAGFFGGKRKLNSARTRNLHTEGEYENIDTTTEPAFAPQRQQAASERLRTLNAAAPAPVAMGSGGSFMDPTEHATVNQKAAAAAVTRSASGGRGKVTTRSSPLPALAETPIEHAAVAADMRDLHSPFEPASRSVTPLSGFAEDDSAEAEAHDEDARDRALMVQRQMVANSPDEEGSSAGSGALGAQSSLVAQAQGPQMSDEELAVFEAGLKYKDSGGDAEAVSGMPANAMAMFGTSRLNAEQEFQVQKKRLIDSGDAQAAAVLARPGTGLGGVVPLSTKKAKKSRKVSTRTINVDELEDEWPTSAAPAKAPAPPGSPQTATLSGFEDLDAEHQGYYAKMLSPGSGISPDEALGMAKRRQSAPRLPPQPEVPTGASPPMPTPAPTGAVGRGPSGIFGAAKNFIGDRLLGAGVLSEYNGWTKQEDAPTTGPPTARPKAASEATAAPSPAPESTPNVTPPSAEDLAFKEKFQSQGPRQPSLSDWVDNDEQQVFGPGGRPAPTGVSSAPANTPVPVQATTAPPATGGSWFGGLRSFFGGDSSSQVATPTPAVTTPAASVAPVPAPVAAPVPEAPRQPLPARNNALGRVPGTQASAMGRDRGRQFTADTQARLASERTMLGGAWAWLSSGGMNQRERQEAHREEILRRHGLQRTPTPDEDS